jgi:hypothetical protein
MPPYRQGCEWRAGYRPTLRPARVAQLVERILGKDEVRGSIPRASLVDEVESLGSRV